MIRRRVRLTGDVQGVFFRDTCRRMASRHDVRGWVRNLPDGAVEAVFEGAEDDVGHLLRWARRGPSGAHVAGMQVREEQPEHLAGFTVLPTPDRT